MSLRRQGLRPEHAFLLSAADVDQSRATQSNRALSEHGLDWEYLVRTAGAHGLAPLLFLHLRDGCPAAAPVDFLHALGQHYARNTRRNFFLTGLLLDMLARLADGGVSAIPYKGPTLALLAYGNLAAREFGDLDILVSAEDVPRVGAILAADRYRRLLPPAREAAFLRYHYEHVFVRPTENVAVEVHWRLAPRYLAYGFDEPRWWQSLQPLRVLSRTVHTFGVEDLLLILCTHAAKDCWRRLAWISDVAHLVSVHKDLDWQHVRARAKRCGMARVLRLGLMLAAEIGGVILPEVIRKELEPDRNVRGIASEVAARIFEPQHVDTWRQHALQMRMRERVHDRVRGGLDLLLTPTVAEWSLCPLPEPLAFLYHALRPVRLSWELGRALGRLAS